MPATSAPEAIQTVDDFINSVVGIDKAAEARTEPGSIGGATTHPIKNVDDHTIKATEGARSAENTKDVKEQEGKPSVDSTPEAKAAASVDSLVGRFGRGVKAADGAVSVPGSAASDQLQIGTNKQPTGEDPKNETASVKATKDDGSIGGPSKHPARTDNSALNGGKYAGDETTPLDKLAADMAEAGNQLCAMLAVYGYDASKEAAATPAPSANGNGKVAAVDDSWLASQVGWEMAGLVTGKFDKQASDSLVYNTLRGVIKLASDRADRVVRFYDSHFAELAKQQKFAEEPPPPPGGGGGGGSPDAMLAAMGGAGGAAGGGGAPPEAGAGAGPPPDAAGGGAGGGVDPETLQMAELLKQLQITPQVLEQMLMQAEGGAGGGGAGGGMPPEAGGGAPPGGGMPPPPPEAGGPPPGGGGDPKLGSDKRGGAKLATEDMHSYIRELVSRTRAAARR